MAVSRLGGGAGGAGVLEEVGEIVGDGGGVIAGGVGLQAPNSGSRRASESGPTRGTEGRTRWAIADGSGRARSYSGNPELTITVYRARSGRNAS